VPDRLAVYFDALAACVPTPDFTTARPSRSLTPASTRAMITPGLSDLLKPARRDDRHGEELARPVGVPGAGRALVAAAFGTNDALPSSPRGTVTS